MSWKKFTDEEAIDVHIKHYQLGKSMADCAEMLGVTDGGLRGRWKKLGLPMSRLVADRVWVRPKEASEKELVVREESIPAQAAPAVNGHDAQAELRAVQALGVLLGQDLRGVKVHGRVTIQVGIQFGEE